MTKFRNSVTAVVAASSKSSCTLSGRWPTRQRRLPSRVHSDIRPRSTGARFKKPGRKRVQGYVMTLGRPRAQYLDFQQPSGGESRKDHAAAPLGLEYRLSQPGDFVTEVR